MANWGSAGTGSESRGRVEIVDGIVKRAVYPEDEADEVTGLVPFWAYLKRVETSQTGRRN